MLVAALRETVAGERRVALTPDVVKALVRQGLEVAVEGGAGRAAGYADADYEKAGARIEPDAGRLLAAADLLVAVHGDAEQAKRMRSGAVLVGLLRPLDRPEAARALAATGVTSFALELVPRITRAQAMDVLSSQANLAGYRAVLVGAVALGKALPMMVTAAGTIAAARVLVIGAGVAGLQAIATARRLGAVVEAYDVRPAVKEQVESLGARFVELPLETAGAEDAGGYAKAQSEEFLARQRELLGQRVKAADIVITTALVPGRRAPVLVDEATVRGMRPGSVVVDLAAEQGGHCAGTRADEVVDVGGVTVLGPTNLPSDVAFHASQMYARNAAAFLGNCVREGKLVLDFEDPITRESIVTHAGEVRNERVKALLGAPA
jgi:NAD(P) transhydrogenase subunit alpha